MTSAVPDEDLPGGGGGAYCARGETRGYYQEVLECLSGNGLYWRIICGEGVEIDVNPTRVLVKSGGSTVEVSSGSTLIKKGDCSVEVSGESVLVKNGDDVSLDLLPDKILSRAPVLEHTGNLRVDGSISVRDGLLFHGAAMIAGQPYPPTP